MAIVRVGEGRKRQYEFGLLQLLFHLFLFRVRNLLNCDQLLDVNAWHFFDEDSFEFSQSLIAVFHDVTESFSHLLESSELLCVVEVFLALGFMTGLDLKNHFKRNAQVVVCSKNRIACI